MLPQMQMQSLSGNEPLLRRILVICLDNIKEIFVKHGENVSQRPDHLHHFKFTKTAKVKDSLYFLTAEKSFVLNIRICVVIQFLTHQGTLVFQQTGYDTC